MTASIKDKKITKKQGPIRTGFLLALLLFSAISMTYSYFFMDIHLRLLSSWTLTKIHGAEVNIEKISTSFINASFRLKNLQVTDKENPLENIIQIEEISFNLLWDALLRAKFVMSDALISQIQIHAKRKTPGHILSEDSEQSSLKDDIKNNESINEVKSTALSLSQKKYKNNALGDIANILGGTDPTDQLESIKTTLQSVKMIEDMQRDLELKQDSWKKNIAQLSSKEEYDALLSRAKSFKFNKKKPFRSLKEISKISKEAKIKLKAAKILSKDISSNIGRYSSNFKNIDKVIEEDINGLTKRLNIPDINMTDMSKDIFMTLLDKKMGSYKEYFTMVEEYLPKKKTAQEKQLALASKIQVQKRQKSKIYQFSIANSYPLVWLQKAKISSKSSESRMSADLTGTIRNITSSPTAVGKPATINMQGDFPHQEVKGFKASIILDRTGPEAIDILDMSIKSFVVKDQSLSKSDKLDFSIKKSYANTKLEVISKKNSKNIKIKNKLSETSYKINASKPKVTRVLTDVTKNIQTINLNASASGTSFSNLDWTISSNFGKRLASGIKGLLNIKMNKAKKKVRDHVLAQVTGKQEKLKNNYLKVQEKTKALLDDKLKNNKDASNKVKETVDSRKKKFSDKSKKNVKKIQNKLKNKFKSKFKKFKF